MVLYLNLFLAHLVGDFVLQPGRLVEAKRRSLRGLLGHVAIITACSVAVLYSDLPRIWPVLAYVAVAHLTIEVVTIRARRYRAARSLFVFSLDQALHLASLVVPVVFLGGWQQSPQTRTLGLTLPPGQLAVVVAMATVVFLGSILVFEAAEAADPSEQERVLPFDWPRLLGMIERGTALGAAFVVGPALLAVPFLPRALLALRLPPSDRARQVTIAASGLILCGAAYAFAAAVAAASTFGTL